MKDNNDTLARVQAKASGSSFYSAMRILPRREREAMFAIYAFCREVDDIADEPGPTDDERRAALDAWRADLDRLYAGKEAELSGFLAPHVRGFGLELADFLAVVDGMEMDMGAGIVAPSFEILDLYCDRVASAVGRLSVKVFGMEREPGIALAFHLGRALQFTNILRDLDEDAEMGRLYLPSEALETAGIAARVPADVVAAPGIDTACRWLAVHAEAHYANADSVMAARPKGRLAAPRLMSAVYGEILSGMRTAGWAPPRARIKPGRGRMLWLALRHGVFG